MRYCCSVRSWCYLHTGSIRQIHEAERADMTDPEAPITSRCCSNWPLLSSHRNLQRKPGQAHTLLKWKYYTQETRADYRINRNRSPYKHKKCPRCLAFNPSLIYKPWQPSPVENLISWASNCVSKLCLTFGWQQTVMRYNSTLSWN